MGFIFGHHAVALHEEASEDHLRVDEERLVGERGIVRGTHPVEDKKGALVLLLHIFCILIPKIDIKNNLTQPSKIVTVDLIQVVVTILHILVGSHLVGGTLEAHAVVAP